MNPDAYGTYALPLVVCTHSRWSSVSSMCGLVDVRMCGCADVRIGLRDGIFLWEMIGKSNGVRRAPLTGAGGGRGECSKCIWWLAVGLSLLIGIFLREMIGQSIACAGLPSHASDEAFG